MRDRRKDCIVWFRAMQEIGLGLGWQPQKMMDVFQEAAQTEPGYYDIYLAHALYLLPRWHGAPGEWEQFADSESTKLGGIEGDILYSEICWRISRYYNTVEFFKTNQVSWPRIRKGFLEREKKYGVSMRYLNAFCLLAGSAADQPTTRALMKRIGDQWEPDFWQEKKYFDNYKKWAR